VSAVASISGGACNRQSSEPAQQLLAKAGSGSPPRDDIAEVVLRHEFKFFRDLPSYSSFCVSVLGADPEGPFLQRFKDVGRDVIPMSACHEKAGQVRDPSSRPAARFEIRGLTSVSEIEAIVTASWDPGHRLAGGAVYEFRVKEVLGQWSVADARMLSVQ
jgi:hypothetical protein